MSCLALAGVPKLADSGYTTVFRPGSGGVTVNEKDTISFKLCKEPVLKGCRNRSGLWVVKHQDNKQVSEAKSETASNIYTLPLMATTVRYLHAAAGLPKKYTWMKAIEMNNYATWPGVNVKKVRKHYPDESIEVQKGQTKNSVCLKRIVTFVDKD